MTTCMLEAKGLASKLWDEAMNVSAHIQNRVPHSSVKGKTHFKSYFGHKLDVSNSNVFGSTEWAQIPHDKRKDLQTQSTECLFIGYLEEYKVFKHLNIRTKQIFIERSVCFEEPLQEVELVEENSDEIPSSSANHLGDESESEGYDFSDMISFRKNISGLESYFYMPNHLPTWSKKTVSSTEQNIRNPTDPRRTWSDFQKAGISLSCHD